MQNILVFLKAEIYFQEEKKFSSIVSATSHLIAHQYVICACFYLNKVSCYLLCVWNYRPYQYHKNMKIITPYKRGKTCIAFPYLLNQLNSDWCEVRCWLDKNCPGEGNSIYHIPPSSHLHAGRHAVKVSWKKELVS